MLEALTNNSFQTNQHLFPESFKIPQEDIINIGNYVLSYPGPSETILQDFFGNTAESQLYGLGLDHITFVSDGEEEDEEEEENEIESMQGSEDLNSGTKSISVYSGERSEI